MPTGFLHPSYASICCQRLILQPAALYNSRFSFLDTRSSSSTFKNPFYFPELCLYPLFAPYRTTPLSDSVLHMQPARVQASTYLLFIVQSLSPESCCQFAKATFSNPIPSRYPACCQTDEKGLRHHLGLNSTPSSV